MNNYRLQVEGLAYTVAAASPSAPSGSRANLLQAIRRLAGLAEAFLDRRVGVPFGWYFFLLHGNRVKSWAGREVLEGAEAGHLVLPEHDYRILRRWMDAPYGF